MQFSTEISEQWGGVKDVTQAETEDFLFLCFKL